MQKPDRRTPLEAREFEFTSKQRPKARGGDTGGGGGEAMHIYLPPDWVACVHAQLKGGSEAMQ